ncbi:MAG TPA: biotin--[acetyl-CoA-carboxylase] ligase [Burkholderiaceae bacterium]|nr:biotin--[acetyl-CoA-carboxylase] ligase [Burkholderiaceae bacterium]
MGAALSASAIAHTLALAWPGECRVEAVATTTSTNEDVAARARAQQPAIRILRAADFQIGGRGRQNRRWHAAPGDALLFSTAIPLAGASPSLPAITLACGVALAECLQEHGVAVQLKWPNDIRVEGRKLGGILTELVSDRNARHTLVTGVGINLHLDDAVRRSIEQPAVALDQLLTPAALQSREQWIGRLGGAIFGAAERFGQLGFDHFRERFNLLLESRGEMVDVDGEGVAPISGRVIEVDRHGRLILETDGRRHAVSVGDVSVRL